MLEVGCGTGDLIASLKTENRVGIDYSSGMIEIARKKYPDIDFFCMEAEDLTFDEPFDYIILSNTIGYLEDIQGVFAGLMKVCHQHTKVIVTYYNFLWQPVLNIAEHLGLRMKQPEQNWLSGPDINNLLYHGGFDAFKGGERLLFPTYIPLLSAGFTNTSQRCPFSENSVSPTTP